MSSPPPTEHRAPTRGHVDTAAADPPISVAVAVDHPRVEPWQRELLGRLDGDVAHVGLILGPADPDGDVGDTSPVRGRRRNGRAVPRRVPLDLPHAPPRSQAVDVSDAGGARLRAAAVDALTARRCAVLLDLTTSGLVDVPDGVPPAGVWRIVAHRVAGSDGLVEVALVRASARPGAGVALQRGLVRAADHSLARTRTLAYASAVDWLAKATRVLASTGRIDGDPWEPPGDDLRQVTWPGVARQIAATGARWAGAVAQREHWNIGVAERPVWEVLADADLGAVRWLDPPPRRMYLADPFALEGSDVVLAEAFDHLTGRGRIVALRGARHGTGYDLRDAIAQAGHLSYPFLMPVDGRILCVPESSDAASVTIYEAEAYPDRWRPVAEILQDFRAVDPTLVHHDGRWWLFCTDEDTGSESNLHVFHADELPGPWRPHLLNPVKVDVRSARPAGPVVARGGRLYRPAQDGTGGYGSALVFNQITRLTPRTFEEHVVARLEPDAAGPYRHGLHTVTAWGDVTLIDGKAKGWSLLSLVGRVRSLVRR